MAKNTGKGYRIGAVKNRSQTLNTKTGHWTKRVSDTGKLADVKSDGTKFKGSRTEESSKKKK